MKTSILIALPILALLPFAAVAQTQNETVTPTIPETQIEPAPLSSPYEFVSVATSADMFIVRASELAETRAASAEVKALAADLSSAHTRRMEATRAAGQADKVEIAAPSVDGEQQGMLGKLEPLEGADFDKSYVEATTFVHQRTIAYYRGFADKGGNLGAHATESLPELIAQYATLTALGGMVGASGAQQPAPAQ
ncbi:MAG: DUF4142 domain-containing protein [Mesorhizobium sp.]|nr:DUF4142 domain-containing protein [Mesorhizobium sp.]